MRFRVLATADGQRIIDLPIEAENANAAELAARRQGYAVIEIRGALPAFKWTTREHSFPLVLLATNFAHCSRPA